MGEKGDKATRGSVKMAELLKERLKPVKGITVKKMFGGHGVFHNGKMFGIVDSKGHCYFKANNTNRPDFEALGSSQHAKMPYFSIPDDILDNPEVLLEWAKKSMEQTT